MPTTDPTKPLAPPAPLVDPARAQQMRQLSARSLVFGARQKRELAVVKAQAKQFGVEVPQEKHRGFWWALDQMDRPRNAVHNAVLRYVEGERDIPKLWDELKQGWSGTDRASFADILERLDPSVQMGLYYPLTQMGVDIQTARKVYGLGGDVLLDPVNLIPGAAIKTVLKPVGMGAKALTKGAGTQRFLRNFIVRGTGIKQLDELYDSSIDVQRYIRSGLSQKVIDMRDVIAPLRKEHRGLVSRLAEETHWDDVEQFAAAVRSGRMGPGATDALKSFHRFRNPGAVRELIGIKDDDTFARALDATKRVRDLAAQTVKMQEAQGRAVPHLGGALEGMAAKYEARFNKAVRDVFREEGDKAIARVKLKQEILKGRQKMIGTVIGPEKLREVMEAIARAGAEDLPARLKAGRLDTKDAQRILEAYLKEISPEFLRGIKATRKEVSAIQAMLDDLEAGVVRKVEQSPRVNKIIEQHQAVLDAMEQVPAYMPHVASAEAMEQLAKIPQYGVKWNAVLRSPRTAADMSREFAVKGRPLSFEEIDRIVRKGELKGAVRTVVADGPLYKHRGIWKRLKGGPKELAQFFDTDELVVLDALATNTAKSVASAEYMNQAVKLFGKLPQGADEAPELIQFTGRLGRFTPAQKARMVRLDEVRGGQEIIGSMPHLKDVWLDRDVAYAMLQSAQKMVNPGEVVRAIDAMGSWWKSHTLPLFPAYHARNVVGNVWNMHLAGSFEPHRFAADMADWTKVSTLQQADQVKNAKLLNGISFHLKATNENVNGVDFLQLAMKNGIIDGGWWSGELAPQLSDKMSGFWKRGSWLPVGTRNSFGVRLGTKVGTSMENNARMTLFAHELRRGKTVREASARVKKFLGDYRSEMMTPFERQVVRFGMPFYRWSRFNIPLQVEQLLLSNKNRAKMLGLLKGARAFAPENVDLADLPAEVDPWIKESAGVPVRRNPESGELEFFIAENWLPSADLDNVLATNTMFKFLASQSWPLISKTFETGIGHTITGKPLRGAKEEFLGQVMDANVVNWLKTLRLVSWLDKMDPLSMFYRGRQRGKLSSREKALMNLGVTVARFNEPRGETSLETRQLDMLRQNIGVVRAHEEAKRKAARESEVKRLTAEKKKRLKRGD